jgi:hypothetical protein
MKTSEFDLETRQGQRLRSPEQCIYCGVQGQKLNDEHVIPYALGANAYVLEGSCCQNCQSIIQPYEQEVLKKQLGTFRAQVEAPTRRRKDRPTEVSYRFKEVDGSGKFVRDLGHRSRPIAEAPLVLNLWSSPPPSICLDDPLNQDHGRSWSYYEAAALRRMCQKVSEETGAKNVAVHLGELNRVSYLRSLAKTGHAYASTVLGIGSFDPLLLDIILCQSDDVSHYVGDLHEPETLDDDQAHTLQIYLGVPEEGPIARHIVVRLQLYPALRSPVHLVVVGRPNERTNKALDSIQSGSKC